jgi:hypothetical protein
VYFHGIQITSSAQSHYVHGNVIGIKSNGRMRGIRLAASGQVGHVIDGNTFINQAAAFDGFALCTTQTNTYIRITNNDIHNWAQYGTAVYTADNNNAGTLPGSAVTIEEFTALGEGCVAGFNIV